MLVSRLASESDIRDTDILITDTATLIRTTDTDTTGRTTTDRIRTMAPITQGHHTTGTAGIAITATIVTIITTVIGIN